MTRRLLAITLLALLAGCRLAEVNRVIVTASATQVAPDGSVVLSARPNFATSSRILWSVFGPDGERISDPVRDGLLDRDTGSEVRFLAPQTTEPARYRIEALAIDEPAPQPRGGITLLVDPFLGSVVRRSAGTAEIPVLSRTLDPGGVVLALIEVTSDAADQALYLELDRELELTLYRDDRDIEAISNRQGRFARSRSALSGLAEPLEPASIVVLPNCRGACIIRNAAPGSYAVRIHNRSNSRQSVALYAFVEAYWDDNEPNDRPADATQLGEEPIAGAIERIGDVDYFRVLRDGELRFSSSSSLPLRAEVRDNRNQQTIATLVPGGRARVALGDLVRVFVDGNDRAAVAALSNYTLELQ